MQYFLLFHSNKGYTKAPQYYFYIYIAYIVYVQLASQEGPCTME